MLVQRISLKLWSSRLGSMILAGRYLLVVNLPVMFSFYPLANCCLWRVSVICNILAILACLTTPSMLSTLPSTSSILVFMSSHMSSTTDTASLISCSTMILNVLSCSSYCSLILAMIILELLGCLVLSLLLVERVA